MNQRISPVHPAPDLGLDSPQCARCGGPHQYDMSVTPEERKAIEARHVERLGSTMEPDPSDPDLMRRTAFCAWCASHRPDEDMRWPCETARLLAALRAAASSTPCLCQGGGPDAD